MFFKRSVIIFLSASISLFTQTSHSFPLCHQLFESYKGIQSKPAALTKSISDPSVSYMAKLLAIRSAKETIDLSVYIFKNDEAGYLVLKELIAAKERGVKIRILVDAFGSFDISGHILAELTKNLKYQDQVQILKINPLPGLQEQVDILNQFVSDLFKLRFRLSLPIARRMHDKILLIDANNKQNAKAIIGSSNIANEYAGLGKEDNNFQDIDLIIKPAKLQPTDGSDIFLTLKDYVN